MEWHVLHVRPRCEKKMAGYCSAHGLEHYLPLRRVQRRYQRRKVAFDLPLFPGYVFIVFDSTLRTLVLKSNFIVRVLDVPVQRQFIREIEQIKKALEVNPALGTCTAMTSGKRVRIASGPFRGIEGVVRVLKPNARVTLNVEIIGQAAVVETDAGYLELID